MPTLSSCGVVSQVSSNSAFPPPILPSTVDQSSKSSASSSTQDLTMQSSTSASSFTSISKSCGAEQQQVNLSMEFRDFGLLEVRLPLGSQAQEEELAWFDAYLIDVIEKQPNGPDRSETSAGPALAMAVVVLVIDGEKQEETLSAMQHVHNVTLEQIRLKPQAGENIAGWFITLLVFNF